MNENQKKLLIGTAALIALMMVYPPYIATSGYGNHVTNTYGYALLLDLPYKATVNVATLLAQWLGALIVAAIAFFVLKDHK